MNVKLCKEKGQIQSVAKKEDCYVTLLNPTTKQLPEKYLENVHALRIDYLTWIPLTQTNTWIYIIPSSEPISLQYPKKPDLIQNINGKGIIQFPN